MISVLLIVWPRKFLNKDCKAFCHDIRKVNVKDSQVSSTINGVSGHEAITKV